MVMAGHFPPPVTGLSAVNAQMRDKLAGAGLLMAAAELSAGRPASRIQLALTRFTRATTAAIKLVRRRRSGATTFYMPVDGGLGLAFNALLAAVARVLGYTVFFHHHSFAYINKRSALMRLLIRLSPKHSVHVVLCEEMGARLQARYQETWARADAQLHVLSNGFLLVSPSPEPVRNPLGDCIVLGHLSNLTVAKGALSAIALFEAARTSGQAVKLILAGPTSDPAVAEAIARTQARHPDHFTWLGAVYGEAKADFYRSIDVFLFPTTYANEAQPLVLLEAISHGRPYLAIERGCIACDHDEAVGLVTADPEAFQREGLEWLAAYAADPNARNRIADACRLAAQRAIEVSEAQVNALLQQMAAPLANG